MHGRRNIKLLEAVTAYKSSTTLNEILHFVDRASCNDSW